jgi:hypothetical protein
MACFMRWRNAVISVLISPACWHPRDRPKTLTALAGAEPLVQAQAAAVQQLQFFLSESSWERALDFCY